MVNRALLQRLAQRQMLFLSIAAIVCAVFWATGQQPNPLSSVIYALLFGNLVEQTMAALLRMYDGRPFPWNWISYWFLLAAISVPVYVLCAAVVWLVARPEAPTFFDYAS